MTVTVYIDSTTVHESYTNVVSCTMVDNARCAICQKDGDVITTNIITVGDHIVAANN